MKILTFIFLLTSIGAEANALLDIKIGNDCTGIIDIFEKNQIKSDTSNPEMPIVIWEFNSLTHTIALECKDGLLTSALAFTMLNTQEYAIDYYKNLHKEIFSRFGKPSVDNEDTTDPRITNAVAKGWIDDEDKYTAQWEIESQIIMISSHKQHDQWAVTYSVDSPSNNKVIIR